MLDPLDAWADKFKSDVPPADGSAIAVQNLAKTVAALMEKVEPDVLPPASYVGPKIFTFNQPIFVQQLITLTPTQGPEWSTKVAAAWLAACQASTITPGTVLNSSVWTASTVDVNTLPSAATTIITLSLAMQTLKSKLEASAADLSDASASQRIFADAFRQATLQFRFTLIGLATGSPPVPVPVVSGAQ